MVQSSEITIASLYWNHVSLNLLACLLFKVIAEDNLLHGNVVVFRAFEQSMIIVLTDFTFVNLIRAKDVFIFILHKQEEMVIHFACTHYFHQLFIRQVIVNAVVKRFYIVC
jgi:hypothetical protein